MLNNECVGLKMERSWKCEPRDYMLYALGVGAKEDELNYIYEKNLKVIPTFATLIYNLTEDCPYMNSVKDKTGILHASNELELYHPLPSEGGNFRYEQKIAAVYDMGDRGAQVISQSDLYGEDGTLLARSRDTEYSRKDGNWGGKPRPADTFPVIPEREPDIQCHDHIAKGQNFLYRLSGDYYPLHADPQVAENYGFKEPIMHGLATYGYICRMAVKELFPGEPERMVSMKGRFKNPLYSDVDITLQIWKMDEGKIYYRLIDDSTGKIVVDKGEICWKVNK